MANILHIDTENIHMDCAVFGNGNTPLVILPGISVQKVTPAADTVEQAYHIFKERFTVYVCDRRDPAPCGYTIAAMAEDTVTALRSIGIQTMYLFGVSQGGMIALHIAAHHPDMVQKLVVGSTAVTVGASAAAIFQNWITLAQNGQTRALANGFAAAVYADMTQAQFGDLLEKQAETYTDDDLRQFCVITAAMLSPTLYDVPKSGTCPTLVIGSKGDKLFGSAASAELAGRLHCALYLYADTYGHSVYDEAPDYTKRLYDFFIHTGD